MFHADDFGIDVEQSRTILSCAEGGALNSTSVMVTSPRFEECARLLDERPEGVRIGVHLNLVEGPCCADPASVPLLVDGRGMFRRGFADLLARTEAPGADELRRQVALEVKSQVERFVCRFPEEAGHLRVDGHQHFQLIPAVFSATLAAVREGGWRLEYLRVPAEPAAPFLQPAVLASIRPVNWVKHLVLNWCWGRDRGLLADYEEVSALFCGVLFSGSMSEGRVRAVFPAYARLAEERGMGLEFLFHPGGLDDASRCLDPDLKGFPEFYLSEGRDVERRALMALGPGGRALLGEGGGAR